MATVTRSTLIGACIALIAMGTAHAAPKGGPLADLENRVAAFETLVAGLQQALGGASGDISALQAALQAERAARAAADDGFEVAVAGITTTETFSARVPVALNNTSLGPGPQIAYTDVASFGRNPNPTGTPRASAFANISNVGGEPLHVALHRKVEAGDKLTLHRSSTNAMYPATLVCCNDSTLTVLWTGIE